MREPHDHRMPINFAERQFCRIENAAAELDISYAEFVRQACEEKLRHFDLHRMSIEERYGAGAVKDSANVVPDLTTVVSDAVSAAIQAYQQTQGVK